MPSQKARLSPSGRRVLVTVSQKNDPNLRFGLGVFGSDLDVIGNRAGSCFCSLRGLS